MVALVTGASSGIGRDIAKELAKRKYNLIIVARDFEKLYQVKEEIETEFKVEVESLKVDLSNKEECIKLYETVSKKYKNIDVLVNNAGFGTCGEFTETDLEKEISMINTNITALHILTKLFLKDMVKRDKGNILNVASIAGFMPGPLMATYYSTKAYVVRLTESIRMELFMKHSKVKVSALCPGPVKTNFDKVADVKFSIKGQTSDKVAKIAVNKMLKNKMLIFTSFGVNFYSKMCKIMPDKMQAYLDYFMQKRKIQ